MGYYSFEGGMEGGVLLLRQPPEKKDREWDFRYRMNSIRFPGFIGH